MVGSAVARNSRVSIDRIVSGATAAQVSAEDEDVRSLTEFDELAVADSPDT